MNQIQEKKVAVVIIRTNAIRSLRQLLNTPDDLVTLKLATQALKAVSALILEDVDCLK